MNTGLEDEEPQDRPEPKVDRQPLDTRPVDASQDDQRRDGKTKPSKREFRRVEGCDDRHRSKIIEEGKKGAIGRVTLGAKVKLRDLTHDEELEYTLVSANEANPRAGRISIASPVGRALLDHAPGDTVEVEAPAGSVQMRIESIET